MLIKLSDEFTDSIYSSALNEILELAKPYYKPEVKLFETSDGEYTRSLRQFKYFIDTLLTPELIQKLKSVDESGKNKIDYNKLKSDLTGMISQESTEIETPSEEPTIPPIQNEVTPSFIDDTPTAIPAATKVPGKRGRKPGQKNKPKEPIPLSQTESADTLQVRDLIDQRIENLRINFQGSGKDDRKLLELDILKTYLKYNKRPLLNARGGQEVLYDNINSTLKNFIHDELTLRHKPRDKDLADYIRDENGYVVLSKEEVSPIILQFAGDIKRYQGNFGYDYAPSTMSEQPGKDIGSAPRAPRQKPPVIPLSDKLPFSQQGNQNIEIRKLPTAGYIITVGDKIGFIGEISDFSSLTPTQRSEIFSYPIVNNLEAIAVQKERSPFDHLLNKKVYYQENPNNIPQAAKVIETFPEGIKVEVGQNKYPMNIPATEIENKIKEQYKVSKDLIIRLDKSKRPALEKRYMQVFPPQVLTMVMNELFNNPHPAIWVNSRNRYHIHSPLLDKAAQMYFSNYNGPRNGWVFVSKDLVQQVQENQPESQQLNTPDLVMSAFCASYDLEKTKIIPIIKLSNS